ncbi:MAG: hypothetical protein WCT46_02985 [Candidatus Gracilibacteria bacterium]
MESPRRQILAIGTVLLSLAATACQKESTEGPQPPVEAKQTTVLSEEELIDAALSQIRENENLELRRMQDCGYRDMYYALDANRDKVRDSLVSAQIFCSDHGVSIGFFNDSIRLDIPEREKINMPETEMGYVDVEGERILLPMGDFLGTVFKDSKENTGWVSYEHIKHNLYMVNDDGTLVLLKREEAENLLNHELFFYKNPDPNPEKRTVEIREGILILKSTNEGSGEKTYYVADIMPWGIPAKGEVEVAGTNMRISTDSIVGIPRPDGPKTEWDLSNPLPTTTAEDLKFTRQSGEVEHHKYLAGLAAILPSSWNIAAMPNKEVNMDDIELVFGNPNWVKPTMDEWGINKSEYVVTVSSNRGVVIMSEAGTYAFGPGGINRGTQASVARIGSIEKSEEDYLSVYDDESSCQSFSDAWREDEPCSDKETIWQRKSLPILLKGIQYIVGRAPFWISEEELSAFDGSDKLERVSWKRIKDGTLLYRVHFN